MFDAPLGGFFRYSSKPDWSEPHREKLLYDQAALLRNYLHAYLLTGEAEWRVHAEGIIEFVESYLFDEEAGAYLGCQDYVAFDSPVPAEATHRQTRPVVDELVYCDANAAMVSACLDAWWLLGRVVCRERAERVLETLWRRLRAQDGRMFHYWEGNRDTGESRLDFWWIPWKPGWLSWTPTPYLAERCTSSGRNSWQTPSGNGTCCPTAGSPISARPGRGGCLPRLA